MFVEADSAMEKDLKTDPPKPKTSIIKQVDQNLGILSALVLIEEENGLAQKSERASCKKQGTLFTREPPEGRKCAGKGGASC